MLGRVHVDVDARRIDLEKQHERRVPTIEQHVAISLAHRVSHQFVAHGAAVDEEILQVRLAAVERRQTDPTPQMQAIALDFDRQRLLQETRAADCRHTPRAGRIVMGLVQAEDGLAVVAQVECHVETRQRQTPDHFLQVIEFGFFGLEKLASRRRVEKQVAHFNRSAHRVGRWLHTGRHVPPLSLDLPGLIGVAGTGGQGQARDGADRCQGLAAKPQAHDLFEVFQVADLAGGVSRQGQRQVIGRNAAAIVAHPQQLDAAQLHIDVDALGAGVEAVFQQLLDHRRRAFNHFTGGNLVRQTRAEELDASAVVHHLIHSLAARSLPGMVRC
ncbi:hypothetical protein D3C87_1339920 [compost metagenome]